MIARALLRNERTIRPQTAGWKMNLLIYAAFVLLAFQLRIVLGEEPWLARRHGSDWDLYKSRVPRWLWHREYLQRNRSG